MPVYNAFGGGGESGNYNKPTFFLKIKSFLIFCYSLDLECAPGIQVLKAWSPGWPIKGMEPLIGGVRSLGYWSVPLNGPVRSQPFPISPFAPWFIMEVVFAPPHIPSMMCCLGTGINQ